MSSTQVEAESRSFDEGGCCCSCVENNLETPDQEEYYLEPEKSRELGVNDSRLVFSSHELTLEIVMFLRGGGLQMGHLRTDAGFFA